MKQILLILAFLLATLLCFGQKEHLEPANFFDLNDSIRYGRYYSKIKEYNLTNVLINKLKDIAKEFDVDLQRMPI